MGVGVETPGSASVRGAWRNARGVTRAAGVGVLIIKYPRVNIRFKKKQSS